MVSAGGGAREAEIPEPVQRRGVRRAVLPEKHRQFELFLFD